MSRTVHDRRGMTWALVLTLTLVALNLLAFNALLAGLRGARIDLTEDRIYSITDATERLLRSLDEDVHVYGYFSERTHPKLQPLVPQVIDLLEEYGAIGGDRLTVDVIDPGDDEQAEEEAQSRFGVQSTPFRLASKYETGIVNAYFALVIQHADQYVRYGFDDLIQVDPLPDGDIDVRLRNLEYDLTRAIKKVVYGYRSSAELFERVEEPVRFTVVMTPDSLPEVLKEVPQAVRDAAAQLREKGGDKFVFEEIDPTGDEEAQQALYQRYGARPLSLGLFDDGEFYLNAYLETERSAEQFDLVGEGVSAAGIREAVENSLRRQTPGFLKSIGVYTPAPPYPPELMMQMRMQGQMPPQPPQFQRVQSYLGQDYQLAPVTLDEAVPVEVGALVVLQPSGLTEMQLFHLDQYLMRGGRVILCAGNYKLDTQQQMGLNVAPIETGLDGWLAHFGVEVERTLVLDDRNRPLPIPEYRQTVLGTVRSIRMAPYPYLVEIAESGFVNKEVAGPLTAMALYWASPVTVDEEKLGESVETIELLASSERSWTDADLSGVQYVEYILPEEGLEPQTLAVALSGRFTSYFKDREPPVPETDDPDAEPATEAVLEESPETRLVVIGDSEFLNDYVADALGLFDSGFFVENLAFMQNLIDWVNLDNDMIAIRSRGAAARRIEEVDKRTQLSVETLNYLVPAGLLLALGAHRLWRRRATAPIVGPAPEKEDAA